MSEYSLDNLPNGQRPVVAEWEDLVDRWSRDIFAYNHLARVLERPHITGIAISGTIGIGLFVTSSEFISIAGSGGCVLGFLIAGAISTAVMRSLAELVSVRPISGGLIDYPHTFVDPALGFACGSTYWVAQCISMAILTSATVKLANQFAPESIDAGRTAGIITGLIVITLLSNLTGVKTYGRIERVVKWLKLLLIIFLCLLMILINLNVGGDRSGSDSGNYTQYSFPPYFRPDGFNTTMAVSTSPTRDSDGKSFGISGASGRFLSVWTAATLAIFCCMGGDQVIVSAGEAKRPHRDLPRAARFMYLIPIGSYLLGALIVGFNINFTDPSLYRPYSAFNADTSHSPFIIVTESAGLTVVPTVLNACFLVSGYTAANTSLYVASRTLFAIAQQYGNPFLKNTLGKTNAGHTPVAAILVSSTFGLLAFLGLADSSFDQPVLALSGFFVGGVSCVYAAECVAFLRFKAGLTHLKRLNIYSRESLAYRKKHFRARWQPGFAWFGLIGSIMIVLTSGWPAIYIMAARENLAVGQYLKGSGSLASDIAGAYSGPVFFLAAYVSYKYIKPTRILHVRELGLDKYILPKRFPGDDDDDAPRSRRGSLAPSTGVADPERHSSVAQTLVRETRIQQVRGFLEEMWSYAR